MVHIFLGETFSLHGDFTLLKGNSAQVRLAAIYCPQVWYSGATIKPWKHCYKGPYQRTMAHNILEHKTADDITAQNGLEYMSQHAFQQRSLREEHKWGRIQLLENTQSGLAKWHQAKKLNSGTLNSKYKGQREQVGGQKKGVPGHPEPLPAQPSLKLRS